MGMNLTYFLQPKSKEDKLEEARAAELIDMRNRLNSNTQVFCCKKCGSENLVVRMPSFTDQEKGCLIPYICRDCGYEDEAVARVKNLTDNGVLEVDIIPDGLIGVINNFTPIIR